MDFDDLLVNAHRLLARAPRRARALPATASATSSSTSTRTRTTRSTRSRTCSPRRTATSWSSATTTSRSTRGAAPTSATSSSSSSDYPEADGRQARAELPLDARRSSRPPTPSSPTTRDRKPKTLWTANAEGETITRYLATDERDEARFIAGEIERLLARRAPPLRRLRGLLPHERAVARARGRVPARRRAVPARRRHALLRARRDPRRDGVPAGGREPRRRGLAQAHHQHAASAASATRPSAALEDAAHASGHHASRGASRVAVAEDWLVDRPARQGRRRSPRCSTSCARSRATCATSSRAIVELVRAHRRRSRPSAPTRRAAASRTSASSSASCDEFAETHADADARRLPGVARAAHRPRHARRGRARRHAHDGAHRQGARVPGRVRRRAWRTSIFPHANSMFEPAGLEEERRLAYVGITRARERLYLTHAHQRMLYGATQHNPPRTFIGEIPEEHMRAEGVGSVGLRARRRRARGDRYGRPGVARARRARRRRPRVRRRARRGARRDAGAGRDLRRRATSSSTRRSGAASSTRSRATSSTIAFARSRRARRRCWPGSLRCSKLRRRSAATSRHDAEGTSMGPILVFGHRNPDNDSICSAVAYAHLKNLTDPENVYVPARLGPDAARDRVGASSASASRCPRRSRTCARACATS